jgi:hypothetical protein
LHQTWSDPDEKKQKQTLPKFIADSQASANFQRCPPINSRAIADESTSTGIHPLYKPGKQMYIVKTHQQYDIGHQTFQ